MWITRDANAKVTCIRFDREFGEYTNDFIKHTQIESCDELFEIQSQIDLNYDGNQELIVRVKNSQKGMFFCGATGNCSTWILSKNGKTYKVILDAGSIEEIKSIKGKSRGFQNISSRYDSGAMNHYIGIYHFNGKKYQLKKCSEEITQIDGTTVFVNKALSDCE